MLQKIGFFCLVRFISIVLIFFFFLERFFQAATFYIATLCSPEPMFIVLDFTAMVNSAPRWAQVQGPPPQNSGPFRVRL